MLVYGGDAIKLSEKLIFSRIKHGHTKKTITQQDGINISRRRPVILLATSANQDIISSSFLYNSTISDHKLTITFYETIGIMTFLAIDFAMSAVQILIYRRKYTMCPAPYFSSFLQEKSHMQRSLYDICLCKCP
jgi:hypothetical protein